METCNLIKKLKQSFEEACGLDDEQFDWLQEVPLDDSLFRCIVCKQNFPYDSISDLTKHEESALHVINIEKKRKSDNSKFDNVNAELDNDVISKSKRLSNKSKKFCPQWLEIEQYKPWLREVQHDENSFSCTVCDKIIAGGLSQVERHAEGKKHKKNLEKRDTRTSESSEDAQIEDELSLSLEERVRIAEDEMHTYIAAHNIPLEAAQQILEFFQQNHDILQDISFPPSTANADATSSDE